MAMATRMPAATTGVEATADPNAAAVQVVIASSDIGQGHDRFAFAILDPNGALVEDATAEVTFFHLDAEVATPTGKFPATYYPGVIEPAGLYVIAAEFDRGGMWGAEITGTTADGRSLTPQRVRFEVAAEPSAPAIGEAPPPTANRTAADAPLSAISSDPEPDPDFYAVTVDEAAASGKPSVIVFATPAYCASRICGPVLNEVKEVKRAWADRVNFIHIEVYETFEPLTTTPLMEKWGLHTEPWVFVLDAAGKVAARLEGSVTAAELAPVLERVAGG
jgi:hypothetical protein